MDKIDFSTSLELWRTPERVALVTSIDENENPQVITVSWFTRVSFDPPMFGISVGQNRTMHNLISQSREFVLAIPGKNLADAVLGCGKKGSSLEDRFNKYDLDTLPAETINSPLIKNCLLNYECVVKEMVDAGDHTVFIGKVKETWTNGAVSGNLVLAGQEAGYEILAESGPYRVGYVK